MKSMHPINKNTFVLLLPIYIFIFVNILTKDTDSLSSFPRGSYNQSCNKTFKCNSQNWFQCVDGLCKCAREQFMIYSEKDGRCLAKSGEKCKYKVNKDNSEDVRRQKSITWYEEIDCVPNSDCNPDGVCSCRKGFFEDSNGECKLQKGYNESCSLTHECSYSDNLMCLNGKCQCDNEISMLYKEECVGRPGTPCLNFRCSENSKCSIPNPYVNTRFHAYHGSSRLSTLKPANQKTEDKGICICAQGYTLSPETKECLGNYRHHCSATNRCSSAFLCIDGVCLCKSPIHQIYDDTYGVCRSYVGGPCNPNGNHTLECINKANCIGYKSYGICECVDGYIENQEGYCNIALDGNCTTLPQISRDNHEHLFCDRITPLNCIEEKCRCTDGFYSHAKRRCLGLVGSRCRYSKDDCIDNAMCQVKHEKIPGRCVCKENYIEINRTCVSEEKANQIEFIEAEKIPVEEEVENLEMDAGSGSGDFSGENN